MKIISRRYIIFFVVVLIIALLFILWKVFYYNNSPNKAAHDGKEKVLYYAEEIVLSLDKGDAEKIKSFLAEKSIEYSADSLDENIDAAIDLLKDNIESYELSGLANKMEKYRNRKPFYSSHSTQVRIRSKDNKTYILSLDYLAVYNGERDNEYTGICKIALFDKNKTDSESSVTKILEIGNNDF